MFLNLHGQIFVSKKRVNKMIINSAAWWDLLLFMLVLSNRRKSPSLQLERYGKPSILYVYFRIFITVSNCLELALRRCRFHSKQNGKLFNCYSIIHTIHWNYFFKQFFKSSVHCLFQWRNRGRRGP